MRCLVGLVGLVCVCSVVAGEVRLPIVGWSSIPVHATSVERYREMQEAGFTHSLSHLGTLENVKRALDAAAQTDIKLLVGCQELKSEPEATVRALMDHPALGYYTLKDEPRGPEFAGLAEWAKRIQAVDSKHPCYINLFPNNATPKVLGSESYEAHIREFTTTVELPCYSFDHYPILSRNELSTSNVPWRVSDGDCYYNPIWYENLEMFAAEMKRVDKPFWAFALSTAHVNPPVGYYPIPTRAALRLQQYSNLAYGAQGLQFFTYWNPGFGKPYFYHEAPINRSGRRSVVYDRLREVIQEIQARAFVFVGARMESVWHTGAEIPRGTKPLGELPAFVRSLSSSDGCVVSHLKNDGVEYLMVLSRELDREVAFAASFAAGVKRVRRDGSSVSVARYSDDFWLEPGEAEIFSWEAEAAETFVEQMRERINGSSAPALSSELAVLATEQASARLLILDHSRDWNTPEALLWEWHPSHSKEIDAKHHALFGHFSDAKGVLDDTHILTAASGGGVALIRRSDKAVLFHGPAGRNPHSIELLPDGNIVAAASQGTSNITVYAVSPESATSITEPARVYPLASAHGLVWDSDAKLLWALGSHHLVGYRYNFDKGAPELEVVERIELKGVAFGGHDLYPVAGTPYIMMSGVGVALFDKRDRSILPVADVREVKSLVAAGSTPDAPLMVQITKTKWWSDTIHYLNKPRTRIGTLSGARFYKARFINKQGGE